MANEIRETLEERGSRYGEFVDNANVTQELMDVIAKAPNFPALTKPHLEAYHMIFHKIARSVCGDPMYVDNVHDIVGYAQLLEDFLVENVGDEK